MWNNLASPPENYRYYKFTDNSEDQPHPSRDVNLEENRTTLFEPKVRNDKLRSVPEERLLNACAEETSINTTQKGLSSLKSTSKAKTKNNESAFDLRLVDKNQTHHRQQSRSMLENKQKSSMNLSQKNQSSSVIREEASRLSDSSKNGRAFLRRVDNQEEEESFSQILAHEVSLAEFSQKGKQNTPNLESSCLYEMMTTLREIKQINKEELITKKKMLKLIQDRSQVSFLYEREDRSDVKPYSKKMKPERKSIRRTQEKSTVKKMGKSIHVEQRLGKIEQKLRALSRRVQEEHHQAKKGSRIEQPHQPKKGSFGRTSKKSSSVFH